MPNLTIPLVPQTLRLGRKTYPLAPVSVAVSIALPPANHPVPPVLMGATHTEPAPVRPSDLPTETLVKVAPTQRRMRYQGQIESYADKRAVFVLSRFADPARKWAYVRPLTQLHHAQWENPGKVQAYFTDVSRLGPENAVRPDWAADPTARPEFLVRTNRITPLHRGDFDPETLDFLKRCAMHVIRAALYRRLTPPNPCKSESRTTGYYTPVMRAARKVQALRVSKTLHSATETLRTALEFFQRSGNDEAIQIALATLSNRLSGIGWPLSQTKKVPIVTKYLSNLAVSYGIPAGTWAHHPGCGHWGPAVSTAPTARVPYGSNLGSACPTCLNSAVPLLNEDGDEYLYPAGTRAYAHPDGTMRCYSPPPIIRSRHSGKSIVGFIPPDGTNTEPPASMLTLGLELEMQAYNNTNREAGAILLKRALTESALLPPTLQSKYLHFEEDGSTGPGGFEMVTGYTTLAKHTELLTAILTDNGRSSLPWAGKLRSHDASGGSCGIHVHATKPTSLLHATKLQYFVNSRKLEPLIRAVARRYSTDWCRFGDRGEPTDAPKGAAEKLKGQHWRGAKPTRSDKRHAISSLSGSRYESLNFTNERTVEFRMFRGSMRLQSVLTALEFTQAVWMFCRDNPATRLTDTFFLEWVSRPENRAQTRNLRKTLKDKGFTVWTARPPKATSPSTAQTSEHDDAEETAALA